jgi:hypothetical protein
MAALEGGAGREKVARGVRETVMQRLSCGGVCR